MKGSKTSKMCFLGSINRVQYLEIHIPLTLFFFFKEEMAEKENVTLGLLTFKIAQLKPFPCGKRMQKNGSEFP